MQSTKLAVLLAGTVILQGCATYKGVGTFDGYNEVYVANVNANLATGGGEFSLVAQKSGDSCRGRAAPPYFIPSMISCDGQRGYLVAQCSDGRTLKGEWVATSCTTGYGSGVDSANNKFSFEFGMTDAEIGAAVAKKTESVADNPDLPVYRPKETRKEKGFATGTGFFISPTGDLLTNRHVIEGASSIEVVTEDGTSYPAQVVSSDEANDIAHLRIVGNGFKYFPLSSSRDVKLGDEVMTLGYPLISIQGQSQKATFGRINSKSGMKDDGRFYQIDVPIQPGNSGGPLISDSGTVVGITTATLSTVAALKVSGALPQNVNYAVKIDYALPMLADVDLGRTPETSRREFSSVIEANQNAVVLVISR